MIALSTMIVLAALVGVALVWLVPGERGLDALALWSALVLTALAPLSAAWMIAATVLVPPGMKLAERLGQQNLFAALAVALLLAAFATAQLSGGIIWVGGAFFTLRQIHVIGEWWMGKLAAPGITAHLRYQLFLPAMFIGPVHRLPNFQRQCERRRWDKSAFWSGAERLLIGAFMAEFLGDAVMVRIKALSAQGMAGQPSFVFDWAQSACDWVLLYFSFAGMTSVALGLSLMMGLQLEENFNHPWRARNLIDFWTRWHISLTSWCRDYVYRPVMALTRSALAGLLAAMLVIGLWHQISFYYVLWSLWQSLGIVLNRVAVPPIARLIPSPLRRVLAPVAILGWLAAARPVIGRLLEFAA